MSSIEEWNYWKDARVQHSMRIEYYKVNEAEGTVTLSDSVFDRCVEEGFLEKDHNGVLRTEFKYKLCNMCKGSGEVCNPSVDASGITQDQFEEDPQFEEDYIKGRYNIQCPTCKGLRVEREPSLPKEIQNIINKEAEEDREYIRHCALEQALGC